MSEKSFLCKVNGDCYNLDKHDPPMKCRACRYEKCILAGMNPSAMQVTEKEATAGNYNKLKKRVNHSGSNEGYEEEIEQKQMELFVKKQVIRDLVTEGNRLQKTVDMLSYLEYKVHKFRMSSYNPHWSTVSGLEDLLVSENKISIADKSGPMPGWPLKSTGPPKMPTFNTGSGPQYSPDKKQWLFYDLMITIEYAKTFPFFSQLLMRDRMILMKYMTLALMNLQISYFSVSSKYDDVVHPDGSSPPKKPGMVYTDMVMSISPLIRCNIQKTEFILLKAICLCNPAVPDLSEHAQKILGIQRENYADALFDHCLRNRKDGPSQFAELIGLVDLLERQQRMQKDLHLLLVAPFVAKIPKEHKMWLVEDIMND